MCKSISVSMLFVILLLGAAPFAAFAQVATYGLALPQDNEADLLQDLKRAEEEFGPEHRALVSRLKDLARFYDREQKYPEAKASYERALAILEKTSGPDSLDVATVLRYLKGLYERQLEFEKVEEASKRQLRIIEDIGGLEQVPAIIRDLASHYFLRGEYSKAELYANRLLTLWEQTHRSDSVESDAFLLLGGIYREQGRFAEAEKIYQRGKAVHEEQSSAIAAVGFQDQLADLYLVWGRLTQAEQLYKDSLAFYESVPNANLNIAHVLYGLAQRYRMQGKYAEAAPLYEDCISRYDKDKRYIHPSSPEIGRAYAGYAELKAAEGRYEQAEELFEKALTALERVAPVHKIPVLEGYASTLRKAGRDAEAEEMEARIRATKAEHRK